MTKIVAVTPAHNEAKNIVATLDALKAQTRLPDRIIVVADACTDDTADIARAAGAEIFTTIGNSYRKAGALNQALDMILPGLAPTDLILIQDADTVIDPRFISVAASKLRRSAGIGAIGALFYGEAGGGLLGFAQRSEYVRYSREIGRKRDRVAVLSGTAALFTADTLVSVRDARTDGRLPVGTGGVYNGLAFTEDDELTLCLKTLGYIPLSPPQCRVITEVMGTIPKLWKQRVRWTRGALENLRSFGWSRTTAPYILRQCAVGFSVLALLTYMALTAIIWIAAGHVSFSVPGALIGLVFVTERAMTVRAGGWRAVLVAALLLPELIYDIFQHAVFLWCLAGFIRNGRQHWAET